MLHYVYKIKMEKVRVIKLQISIELSNCLKWLICNYSVYLENVSVRLWKMLLLQEEFELNKQMQC